MESGAETNQTTKTGLLGDSGVDDQLTFRLSCPGYQITDANAAGLAAIGGHELPLSAELVFEPNDLARIRLVVEPLLRRGEAWAGRLRLSDPDLGGIAATNTELRADLIAESIADDGTVAIIAVGAHDAARKPGPTGTTGGGSGSLAGEDGQTTHDALTGLPNEVLLADRLGHALARSRRYFTPTAVMSIELSDLTVVSDELVCDAAERLGRVLRPSDTLAAVARGRFVALCTDLNDRRQVLAIAHRLAGVLALCKTDGDPVKASIGVAVTSDGEIPVEVISDQASQAMAEAIRVGGDQVIDYGSFARETQRSSAADEHAGPGTSETELRFDPVIDLSDGYTALISAHPYSPGTGELAELDGRAVTESIDACVAKAVELYGRFGTDAPVVTHRVEHHTIPDVFRHIDSHLVIDDDLPFDGFSLELDDDVVRSLGGDRLAQLHDFAAAGIALSVTGFRRTAASVGQIHSSAARIIKIEPMIVEEIDADHAARATERVRDYLAIGAEAEVAVVAAGVTRSTQVAALVSLGCRYAQGPLFGTKLRSGRLDGFLENPVPAFE